MSTITSTIPMMAVQKPALKIPPAISQELRVTARKNTIAIKDVFLFM
jgi:hypothetical protein